MKITGMELVPVLVLVAIVAIPLCLVALLVVRDRRRRGALRALPVITEVADYSSGVLACPSCRGTSFVSPPSSYRDFSAFALGPFVFGSMSGSGLGLVECVTCGGCFHRGVFVEAPQAAVRL